VFPRCCRAEFTDRPAQIHATSIAEKTPSYGDLGAGLRFPPPLQKQLDGAEAPVEDGLVEQRQSKGNNPRILDGILLFNARMDGCSEERNPIG
jgi:hypothetical protein